MKRKIMAAILSLALLLSISAPVLAVSEQDTAVEYLASFGVMTGNEHGDLMLDKGLTRAELAVILTRLDYVHTPQGLAEWTDWGMQHFSAPENRYNTFTDLPQWTNPYVEYCYQRSLMIGVGDGKFAPQSMVNPQMVCTVMLRYCGIAETDWSYASSIAKAKEIGLVPEAGVDGDIILRQTMAVIVYRGMRYVQADLPTPIPPQPEEKPSDPAKPVETPEMTLEEMCAEIVRLANIERVKMGVPELEVLPALMLSAQAKAQDFWDNNYYSHISPRYGTPGELVRIFVPEAKTVGENIAGWCRSTTELFNAILSSPGHYAIMVDAKYTHIGVGVFVSPNGVHWMAQQFITLD